MLRGLPCIANWCRSKVASRLYFIFRCLHWFVKVLAERLFADAMVAMHEAPTNGHACGGHPVHEDALAQQHELIRQTDEYADLFTHAAMMASAAVSRAMDAAQGEQGGQS